MLKTILFLHGWGCNLNYMLPLTQNINNANLLLIDLPGFGKNNEFDEPKTIYDFVDIIYEFLIKNNYKIDCIVGHSFGGKLAILLANKLKVASLLLLAPSIYNKKRNLLYYLKIYIYKAIKNIKIFHKLLPLFGSKDYKALTPVMKKTMSNVINTDVEKELLSLTIPIILFYGKKDKITPKYIGKKIKKKSHDAALFIIDGDHFAYLHNIIYIDKVLESLVDNSC